MLPLYLTSSEYEPGWARQAAPLQRPRAAGAASGAPMTVTAASISISLQQMRHLAREVPHLVGTMELARVVEHRNLGDIPAIVGALDLKLDHGDGVRWAADDAEAAADTLFLVNDHVGAALPG